MAVTSSNTLTIVSTNSSNNTAVVKYVVKCTCSGSSYNNYEQKGTFYIDGTKYTNTYKLPSEKTTTVFSKQVTVSNASGRKINASYSFPTTPTYGTKEGSTSVTIPVLVQAPTINSLTLKSRTLNSLTFSYTLSATTSSIYYKLSTVSGYTRVATNVKTGQFTVSGLSPNTSYTINFLARNTSGSTSKDTTRNVSGTTFDIGKITSATNFEHGNSANLTISNPSRK